jgi:hypothetical protein
MSALGMVLLKCLHVVNNLEKVKKFKSFWVIRNISKNVRVCDIEPSELVDMFEQGFVEFSSNNCEEVSLTFFGNAVLTAHFSLRFVRPDYLQLCCSILDAIADKFKVVAADDELRKICKTWVSAEYV